MVIDEILDEQCKAYGISKGWKLAKLGKRSVIKSSFIMLKNQLMAQSSTAKLKGYELTFIDENYKENSVSTPNSPNGQVQPVDSKKDKIPKTVPLKPKIAPITDKKTDKIG